MGNKKVYKCSLGIREDGFELFNWLTLGANGGMEIKHDSQISDLGS